MRRALESKTKIIDLTKAHHAKCEQAVAEEGIESLMQEQNESSSSGSESDSEVSPFAVCSCAGDCSSFS